MGLMNNDQQAQHKIALYIRVSTEEQAENPEGSIKSQEQRLRTNIQLKNMESCFGDVTEVFIDRARSGKDTNRPELQRMLSAIGRREITMVMVTDLSRLSRSIKDFCDIWEHMRKHSCQFQSLREQFDTTTAAGEMVLYTIANIAQFERRQVAERVTANLQARSMRGLYNGGIVPLGYRTIPGKKGHLEIDEEQAPVIRKAFDAFLEQGTLTRTATWLNQNGYKIPRKMTNGGSKPRMGHFTMPNLHHFLRNKAYVGIKTHKINGRVKEAKAVWPAIVDETTFNRVQELLDKNYSGRKHPNEHRYSFDLAGLLFCGTCGERLPGKSAHGNGGKIPYYEHGWLTKRQACLLQKSFACKPNRILARTIENLVWKNVQTLLLDPSLAKSLVKEAQETHRKHSQTDEAKKVKEKLKALCAQIEALAERIAQLPPNLPAAPFYKQMEKIVEFKQQEEERLTAIQSQGGYRDLPTELAKFEQFLAILDRFSTDPIAVKARNKIIQKVIHKIEITPDSYKLYFHVGRNYIEGELANASSLFSKLKAPKTQKALPDQPGEPSILSTNAVQTYFGSNSLTYGWGTRIRT